MSYYAASQAVRVVGKGNQVTWHPGIKGFLTGVHEDTRDEDGNEIPENIPAAVREAWESEPAPEQSVLIEFAAELHDTTGIPFDNRSVTVEAAEWLPVFHATAVGPHKNTSRPAGAAGDVGGAPKKRRK